jgi:hypothetical protein
MLHQNTCPGADISKTLHAEELFGRAYLARCAWTVKIRGVPTGNPGEMGLSECGPTQAQHENPSMATSTGLTRVSLFVNNREESSCDRQVHSASRNGDNCCRGVAKDSAHVGTQDANIYGHCYSAYEATDPPT